MPVISTNIAGNAAFNDLNMNTRSETGLLSRLASGNQIVQASDDAAGLAIGSQLQADQIVYDEDQVNVRQGTAVLQSADGGLSQISSILTRMLALATEAASGQVTNQQRQSDLNTEYQQLAREIDSVVGSTSYAGQSLLSGSFLANTKYLIGTTSADVLAVSVQGVSASGLLGSSSTTTTTVSVAPGQAQAEIYVNSATNTYSGLEDIGNITGQDVAILSNGWYYDLNGEVHQTPESYHLQVPITNVTLPALGYLPEYVDTANGTLVGLASDGFYYRADGTVLAGMAGNGAVISDPGPFAPVTVTSGGGTSNSTGTTTYGSSIATAAGARAAIDKINGAIGSVTERRAVIGAYESRFDFTSQDIATNTQSISAAASVIMDADVAQVKASLSAADVKTQAAVSAVAQASQLPTELLRLLES